MLARNDNYWGPNKPVFPKVTLAEVKDSSSQLQQLQSGDADIAMQISVDSVAQLEGNADVTTKIVDSYNFVYIALSPGAAGGEKLQDVNVRKAIKEAIDYDGAIQALVAGKGKKQASPIPNGFTRQRRPAAARVQPRRRQEAVERRRAGRRVRSRRHLPRRQRVRRRLQPDDAEDPAGSRQGRRSTSS